MRTRTAVIAAAGVVSALTPGASGQPVSVRSLLNDMTDPASIARWPAPGYTCVQFSSYDRRSIEPRNPSTWYANDDWGKFIRTEERDGRAEHVLMDAEGPGAVVRFWSANPKGTVRFYLDGSDTPTIAAPLADVLGGTWGAAWGLEEPLAGERARGWNLYLPVPYAKRCKVTCDDGTFYYQINVRNYDPGTEVETFTVPDKLPAVAAALRTPSTPSPELTSASAQECRPGERRARQLPPGPGAVDLYEIKAEALTENGAWEHVVIEMTFDGERTVWCPVRDFFGSGAGFPLVQDVRRSVEHGRLACSWVMLYQKSGEIAIVNLGASPVKYADAVRVRPWTWDDRSMHFGCSWRHEYPVNSRPMSDWNYVELSGRGVYAGDNLVVMNPAREWWGEGDEKIYVDAEKFPSHFGTGTEDYYGYAWCSPTVFRHPFHAQPRVDGQAKGTNWGHTAVTRLRALDGIPFRTALRFDMEVWHWAECEVALSATTYFYAFPGVRVSNAPMPDAVAAAMIVAPPIQPSLKIAGAIECEEVAVRRTSAGTAAEPQEGFGPKLWSGDAHLWIRGKQTGDFVELDIPAEGASARRVTLYATKSWDYGVVRFAVNGEPAGSETDLYCGPSRKVVSTGPIDLGVHRPRQGLLRVRAELVSRHASAEAPGTYFGLDCVVLGE